MSGSYGISGEGTRELIGRLACTPIVKNPVYPGPPCFLLRGGGVTHAYIQSQTNILHVGMSAFLAARQVVKMHVVGSVQLGDDAFCPFLLASLE